LGAGHFGSGMRRENLSLDWAKVVFGAKNTNPAYYPLGSDYLGNDE